jgi:hypothetical protein
MKTSDDDIMTVLGCVDENLSEVESSGSDNEIGDNKESDCKSAYQRVNKVMVKWAPVVSGWHDVKWQMKIWLLGAPQWYDVYIKYLQNTFCMCTCAKNA